MARVIPAEAMAFLRGALGDEGAVGAIGNDGTVGITITGVDQTSAGPRVRFNVPRLRRRRGDTRRMPDREAIAEAVSRMVALRWKGSVEPRAVPAESYLALIDEHPEIYDAPTETGAGWHWLLASTAEWIKEIGRPDDFNATQVKEKFGTLRFYFSCTDENGQIDRITRAAEWVSGAVCETCGAPGSTRATGWVRTACDAHAPKK